MNPAMKRTRAVRALRLSSKKTLLICGLALEKPNSFSLSDKNVIVAETEK